MIPASSRHGLPLASSRSRRWPWLVAACMTVGALAAALYLGMRSSPARVLRLRQFLTTPAEHADWQIHAGDRCGEASFLLPTDGYIGFAWGDSFRLGQHHQGIDIFGPTDLGQTPVVAAVDGYLTRLPDWRSAVIVRVPDDPLQPGRQIWIYHTHMADAQGRSFIDDSFPAGTSEQFVRAGRLLGFQGNYSANPDNPTGMHLDFSIVRDDGTGRFRNELVFANTVDPTPYLGIEVNADRLGGDVPLCRKAES